jgi:hypothetical protein
MNRVRRCASLGVILVIVFVAATQAAAQHEDVQGGTPPPPPPSGNGVLTIRVVHATQPAEVAGIAIALYALSPDGRPGFTGGETNADGILEVKGISNDPGVVYLAGASFRDISFGERVTFAEGETTANVEIEVREPTDQTAGVAIEELRLRIDWMGDRLLLREILSLSNASEHVIQLPAEDHDRSIVVRPLGLSASDFSGGIGAIGARIALENGGVRFWGPLYPGEQAVEYQYHLPIPAGGGPIRVPVELGQAAARLVVVAGTGGLEIRGAQLIASSDVQSNSGPSLKSWARAGLAAGEKFEIDLTLPEIRRDASLLSIPRSDVWLELDDTLLTAKLDIQIEVEPGAPVSGTLDAPLLRVSLPEGATLQGIAPEAQSLGIIPSESGGFDIIGPVGPGTTSLGYSYQMAAGPEGLDLDMRFPGEVETLNVLIADTGLALDSGRLHRRRPFRSGTRNFLHREAFSIAADEIVDLRLQPLGATGLSQTASNALALVALVAGALFLIAPLLKASRVEAVEDSPAAQWKARREAIYTAIDDLDHDFETAKLDETDYTQMRDGLRAEAIELLRTERDAAAQPAPSVATGGVQTDAYCQHCGQGVIASWRFCSRCGKDLKAAEEASG